MSDDLNPELDLEINRILDVPVDLVWRAWTEPELLKQWWCPLPWTTPEARIDLRVGGEFYTRMQGPNGEGGGGSGCYLELVENERLVWTGALQPGFRPQDAVGAPFLFTGKLLLEAQGDKTHYRAIAMHSNAAGSKAHEEMGFHEGWGEVANQLEALMKKQ